MLGRLHKLGAVAGVSEHWNVTGLVVAEKVKVAVELPLGLGGFWVSRTTGPVGLTGSVAGPGVTALDAAEAALVPNALVAVTVNV